MRAGLTDSKWNCFDHFWLAVIHSLVKLIKQFTWLFSWNTFRIKCFYNYEQANNLRGGGRTQHAPLAWIYPRLAWCCDFHEHSSNISQQLTEHNCQSTDQAAQQLSKQCIQPLSITHGTHLLCPSLSLRSLLHLAGIKKLQEGQGIQEALVFQFHLLHLKCIQQNV